ncbi:MAG TPA: hypothetical protein VKC34_17640 [Blastocatellia bacterium]|nr:hypothetical protein [Blastocatellia bacterium]
MPLDNRDILEVLRAELDFIEKGGYGRSVRTPWKPSSVFRDSPSCLNLGDTDQTHPCSECFLLDFVPTHERGQTVPCHHILLNDKSETVETMDESTDGRRLEESVKRWLRSNIERLERERAGQSVT